MSDMFLGSQAPMYQNVCIRRRSKTGKILEERHAKNRVTRLMLFGMGKFLLGQFNNSSPDKIYEYIPRYLALGSNTPGPDALNAGVSSISSVNDTRLLNEIKYSSTSGASESVKRIWIAERNMCKLNTKFSDPFIKISIKTYVSSNHYDGMTIGEAGLFSKEQDNNCLARVCFNPIVKNPNEVLDIQWDITLLSYGETKYPEKIELENGSKITLPLKYTSKFFKEINTGLKIYKDDNTIGSEIETDLFSYDLNGKITANYTNTEYRHTSWFIKIQNQGLESIFDSLITQISHSTLDNTSNPYYLVDTIQTVPTLFHFGSLGNTMNSIINNDQLNMTLLYNEDVSYIHEDTGWTYSSSKDIDSYVIYSDKHKSNEYKIKSNRFYKKNNKNLSEWIALDAFLYKGTIVNMNQEFLGYTYSDNKFYKSSSEKVNTLTYQFLNYSNIINEKTLLVDEKMHIYKFDEYGTIQRSGYTIDYSDDNKIFLNGEFTDYHLSNDNYWVTGEYVKLIPIITPKDATDRSVTWFIQNKDIAKINWDGVVTAWNLGETTTVVSTSNDLRAKCIIDVVKESKFIDIDSITLEPSEITMIVDGDINQQYTLTATIEPLFASNSTVNWSMTSELSNCISLIHLGDNKVKLVLNGSGNIGSGYVTATSQSGKFAECFVRVVYNALYNDCDCPDESHLQREV